MFWSVKSQWIWNRLGADYPANAKTVKWYWVYYGMWAQWRPYPWWRHQMETFSALLAIWGIHRFPVNSPHKGQWRGALMFSLICVWINRWENNREAGDLRRYRAHYDVIVMHTSRSYWILHKYSRSRGACLVRRQANNIFLHKIKHIFRWKSRVGSIVYTQVFRRMNTSRAGVPGIPWPSHTRWWAVNQTRQLMTIYGIIPCHASLKRNEHRNWLRPKHTTHHPHTPSSEIPNYYVKFNQRKFGSSFS